MSNLLPVYNRSNLEFSYGKGPYLFTKKKEKFLDFASGIAVNSLGHSHPKLIKTLEKQSKKLWHVSNLYKIEGLESLAKRICELSNMEYAFFTNSGAEAIECGIKMARKYHFENNHPERNRIITFKNAFHGRTNGCIATSDQEKMVRGFSPLLDGFDIVETNIESVKNALNGKTAAILIEPIQGEGGINEMSAEFLKDLRQLADEKNILLFFDEVQCGISRTGRFFAHQWYDVQPDIIASAKGIGGGFPVGSCLCNKKVGDAMNTGSHGSTYGNNPLAVAIAQTVLNEVSKKSFLKKIIKNGNLLKKKLGELKNKYPNKLEEIKGKGLMLGIKIKDINNVDFVEKLREKHLLTVPAANNVVRILPPLNIKKTHIKKAVSIIENILKK